MMLNRLPRAMLTARCYSSSSSPTGLVRSDLNVDSGLCTLTMEDLRTRNALSLAMMTALLAEIGSRAAGDGRVRSICLRAAGDVFSSGHNLKELTSENGVAAQARVFATCTKLMMAIRSCPVPVFAAVDGLAAAAGCQLVAASDFAFCTERATFSTPGASFGLFCSTPSVPLSRRVGRGTAAWMVLTGDTISSREALASGLVVRVVRDADAMASLVSSTASSISAKSRSVTRLGKAFFHAQLEQGYEQALAAGEEAMVRNLQLRDCQEGLDSFKGKRKPVWGHGDEVVVAEG